MPAGVMALAPGTRLGPYEIGAQIGVGGMGEVYRATDTNLGRQVAIKVLPDTFAQDPERLARFDREAKTLAALNHPNIAIIHGLEKADGIRALVMELVEGSTLADRIAQGPSSVEEALPIARQIADALEAAHEQSIIHRDLKPANVKIRPDGTVKVLDFGLAKAMEPAGASRIDATASPTITSPAMMTGAGVLLGTAAYMSPEQARGKMVDKRADIWAFGCVLYEMVTGQRAFGGDTVTDTLAQVLEREPSWDRVPVTVRPLLQRCLLKDRARRLRDIGDAAALLELSATFQATPITTRAPGRWRWPTLAVAFATVATIALWGWLKPPPTPPRMIARFAIPFSSPPPAPPFPFGLSISRDGSRIAYAAGGLIQVRGLDQLVSTPLQGTESGIFPALSPDGQWVAFSTGRGIQRMSVLGGPAQVVAPQLGGGVSLPFWGTDDVILFANTSGLYRVASRGGEPETLASVDASKGETAYQLPQLLPGGNSILFGVVISLDNTQAAVLNLDTKERRILSEITGSARFVPSKPNSSAGHLLFASAGTLVAAPFDVERLEVLGPPRPVAEGLARFGSASLFDVSDNGTLIYAPGPISSSANNTLVWVDRRGNERPIDAPPGGYGSLALSPDGKKIALQANSGVLNADISIYHLDRRTLERRTNSGRAFNPVWARDKLIFREGNLPSSALMSMRSDATAAEAVPLTASEPGAIRYPMAASPDGSVLVGTQGLTALGADNQAFQLPLLETSAGSKPTPFLDRRGSKLNLRFSPDGQWVAYEFRESARPEIWVAPFPGPGGMQQVARDGTQPRWSPDGRELFFKSGTRMMSVEVETKPTFRLIGMPKMLFDYPSTPSLAYDVASDGRFLMIKYAGVEPSPGSGEIEVALNWTEELKQRVPTR
jgi:serine/threonine protein kinase